MSTPYVIPQRPTTFPMPQAQQTQPVPMQTQQQAPVQIGRPTGKIYTKTPNDKCPQPGRKYETCDETQSFCWLGGSAWESHDWEEKVCSQGANEGLMYRTCKKTGKFEWIDNPRKRKNVDAAPPSEEISKRIDRLENILGQCHQMLMQLTQTQSR